MNKTMVENPVEISDTSFLKRMIITNTHWYNFFEINESSIVKSTMRTENPDEINDNSCEECYYIPAGPATMT